MTVKRLRCGNSYRPINDDSDPILYEGELAVDSETGDIKVGDGYTEFSGIDPLPVGQNTESTINGGTP